MGKFVFRIFVALCLSITTLVVVLVVRICVNQKNARAAFRVREDVEVLCLGNSHTGCSWIDNKRFKNQVIWHSARGLIFPLYYLREIERQGGLENVKTCIVDCDASCIGGFRESQLRDNVSDDIAITWRYLATYPGNASLVILSALEKCGKDWELVSKELDDGERRWVDYSELEQSAHLRKIYGTALPSWDSPPFVGNWRSVVIDCLKEMRSICDRHNIRLILFASPLVSANPQRIEPAWCDEVEHLYGEIKSAGFEFHDLRASCDDSMFRDSHHLSKDGALAFTERSFALFELK